METFVEAAFTGKMNSLNIHCTVVEGGTVTVHKSFPNSGEQCACAITAAKCNQMKPFFGVISALGAKFWQMLLYRPYTVEKWTAISFPSICYCVLLQQSAISLFFSVIIVVSC